MKTLPPSCLALLAAVSCLCRRMAGLMLAGWAVAGTLQAQSQPVPPISGIPGNVVRATPAGPQTVQVAPTRPSTTSVNKQFVIYGADLQTRSGFAEASEDAAASLSHLFKDDGQFSFTIVIDLKTPPDVVPTAPAVSTSITQMEPTGFHLQVRVQLRPDFRKEDFSREMIRILLAERILRHHEQLTTKRQRVLPDWVLAGVTQALEFRSRAHPSALFAAVFRSGQVYGIDQILSADSGTLDALARAIYDTSSCALVLTLLDQPDGPARFAKFLSLLAVDSGSDRDLLLRQCFPGFSSSQNSLEKWWSLQMATLATPSPLETLTINETEAKIDEALALQFDDKPAEKSETKGGMFHWLKRGDKDESQPLALPKETGDNEPYPAPNWLDMLEGTRKVSIFPLFKGKDSDTQADADNADGKDKKQEKKKDSDKDKDKDKTKDKSKDRAKKDEPKDPKNKSAAETQTAPAPSAPAPPRRGQPAYVPKPASGTEQKPEAKPESKKDRDSQTPPEIAKKSPDLHQSQKERKDEVSQTSPEAAKKSPDFNLLHLFQKEKKDGDSPPPPEIAKKSPDLNRPHLSQKEKKDEVSQTPPEAAKKSPDFNLLHLFQKEKKDGDSPPPPEVAKKSPDFDPLHLFRKEKDKPAEPKPPAETKDNEKTSHTASSRPHGESSASENPRTVVPKAQGPTVADYTRIWERKDRAEILTSNLHRLHDLQQHAHSLYKGLIGEYSAVVQKLIAGKTKGVTARLSELQTERQHIHEKARAVESFVDWYEASQNNQWSGYFDDYLKLQKKFDDEVPKRTDEISKYLDAVEKEYEN